MKKEEQPKPILAPEPEWHKSTALRRLPDTMARAQAEADRYRQLAADQDALIDEIIDLKQKLNAMVRIANVVIKFVDPRRMKETFPEADQLVWNQLVRAGYGGDEVPE
jgi:hypothetical protein